MYRDGCKSGDTPELQLSLDAFATEGGYSIGAGGISFQVGNGTARDGGTIISAAPIQEGRQRRLHS